MSLHGERAWYLSYENTSRLLGMMYYGAYAREKEDLEAAEDDFIYIGYNFHWENRSLALPNLPEGMCWKKIADTSLHGTGFCLEEEEEYKKINRNRPPRHCGIAGQTGGGERCDHGTRGCTSGPSRGISFW